MKQLINILIAWFFISSCLLHAQNFDCSNKGKLPEQDFDCDGIINQEDLDDDNDGVPDTQELCISEKIPFLGIQNPDFEENSSIPNSFSQMDRVLHWDQATRATSDFYHNQGYRGNTGGLSAAPPTPSGNGFVGCLQNLTSTNYHEYVSSVLTTPMETGKEYTLEILVGALNDNSWFGGAYTGDIAIYGFNHALIFPIQTRSRITGAEALARKRLNIPKYSWQTITVSFTPTFDVNVLVIGGENGRYKVLLIDNIKATQICNWDDYDNDGFENKFDSDSDGDGCSDAFEAGAVSDNMMRIEQHPNFKTVGQNGLADFLESSPDQGNPNFNSSEDFLDSTVNNCPICTDTIPPKLTGIPESRTFPCFIQQSFDVSIEDEVNENIVLFNDSTVYQTGSKIDSIKYRWWASDFCQNRSIDSVTIRYADLDTFFLEFPKWNICQTEEIEPYLILKNPTAEYSYEWESADSNLQITNANRKEPSFDALVSGRYEVSLTLRDSFGCAIRNQAWLEAEVVEAASGSISGFTAFCEKQKIELEASPAPRVEWIMPNKDSFEGQKLSIPNARLGDAGTYTAIFHYSDFCKDTATHSIDVDRFLIPNPKGPESICLGEVLTIELASSPNATYNWFFKDSLVATESSPSLNSTIFGLGDHQLSVTISSTDGCPGAGIFSFTVKPQGEYELPNDKLKVEGGAASFEIIGFENVVWTGPNNFFSLESTIQFDKLTLDQAGYYNYLAVSENGCQKSDSVYLDILKREYTTPDYEIIGCNQDLIKFEEIESTPYTVTIDGKTYTEFDKAIQLPSKDKHNIFITSNIGEETLYDTLTIYTKSVFSHDVTIKHVEDFNDGEIDLRFDGYHSFKWLDYPSGDLHRKNLTPGSYTIFLENEACFDTLSFEVLDLSDDDSNDDDSDDDDSDDDDSDDDDSNDDDSNDDDSDDDDSNDDDSNDDDSNDDDSNDDDSNDDDSNDDDSNDNDSDDDDSNDDDSDDDDSDDDDSDDDDSNDDDSNDDDSNDDDSNDDDSNDDDSNDDDSNDDDSNDDDSNDNDSNDNDSNGDDSDDDDSNDDDSNNDDSNNDDLNDDDSNDDDSNDDDSNDDDSNDDDSNDDDSNDDDSNDDGSDDNDSDDNDSNNDDSNDDDSDDDDSDDDDSNDDDSNDDDSNDDDSETIIVFLDSLNNAEICFPYDKEGDDFYIQKVCGKGNGIQDIEFVNDVCLRINGSISTMQENCYIFCTNQSCDSFKLQVHPYTPPLKLRRGFIEIQQNGTHKLILDENPSDSFQITLTQAPETGSFRINNNMLEVLSSSLTCGELDSITYQVETTTQRDTATLFIEGECLTISAVNGFSPNGDGINDYFIIQNIETLSENWVGVFNRNGNLVFQQKNYSNEAPWNGTFNEKRLPEGVYFYIIKTGEDDTILDGYLLLNW